MYVQYGVDTKLLFFSRPLKYPIHTRTLTVPFLRYSKSGIKGEATRANGQPLLASVDVFSNLIPCLCTCTLCENPNKVILK